MYYGEKVKLRAYRKEDIEQACKYMNDYEIKKFLAPGVPYPMMLEQESKWYDSLASSMDSYNFAIEDRITGIYIGGCGINNVDWKNSIALIGIFIGDKSFWNKGYGTDALNVLLKFIFEEMNVNKVKLNVYSFNPRAKRCYEKCGFVVEGTLREELFREGAYHDVYIMSILKSEWLSLNPK